MDVSRWCTRIIRWSFYLLFIIVPLILTPWNYELFEFNKMMVTYAVTAIIVGAWIIKMIADREVRVAKTPLDVPIVLFVVSQFVSSIFSIDAHVSWFGYYSRFNGGMWSIISYALLYYAFVTTMITPHSTLPIGEPFTQKQSKKAKFMAPIALMLPDIMPFLRVMLTTGIIISLYAVLERMGIDKHLWVQDVQNRVFSTLGQPNWLAAYIIAMFPVSMALAFKHSPKVENGKIVHVSVWSMIIHIWWMAVTVLFFTVLLFTRSRSGLLGLAAADVIFWGITALRTTQKKLLIPTVVLLHALFAIIVFFNGSNITQIDKYFTYNGVMQLVTQKRTAPTAAAAAQSGYVAPALESGGTESGTIRKYVWQAAIYAWQSSVKTVLIGTGTETFAFDFYQFRPAGHNMTSEWDFLYNKAHNEYLNYLATTGSFGLISYLLLLGSFIVWYLKNLKSDTDFAKNKDTALSIALFAGWMSILITNFFGFSVVILQIFLFLFPAFVLCIHQSITTAYTRALKSSFPSSAVTIGTIVVTVIVIAVIVSQWYADTLYATSYRLARSGQFVTAQSLIQRAEMLNPGEPVYRDEMSTTLTALATAEFQQQNATAGAQLAQQALEQNDAAIKSSPQNVNFWKTRTKLYYALSAYDPKFNDLSITALEKARELSPNDPKIYYNLAILYGRSGNNDKAIELLKTAIAVKPDYHDAYYGLYVFDLQVKKTDDARNVLVDYLHRVNPNDAQFLDLLGKAK